MVKNLPVMQETWVQSLGWEGPLEEGMATHSSILAWKIPWTGKPGGPQSVGSQRVRHDWATNTFTIRGVRKLAGKDQGAFGNSYNGAQSISEVTLVLGSTSVALVQGLAPVTLVWNYWSPRPRACALQQEKPPQREAHVSREQPLLAEARESPHAATKTQ